MKIITYAFDIDGVICKTINSDYKNSIPDTKAIKKINSLHDKGHKIIIFTARFMGRTNNDFKQAYEIGYDFTLKQLRGFPSLSNYGGIPIHHFEKFTDFPSLSNSGGIPIHH